MNYHYMSSAGLAKLLIWQGLGTKDAGKSMVYLYMELKSRVTEPDKYHK